MSRHLLLWVALACATAFAEDPAMRPGRQALDKYQTYVREAEAGIQREIQSPTYLWAARSPARWERVRGGEAVVESWNAQGDFDIGDALDPRLDRRLLHLWREAHASRRVPPELRRPQELLPARGHRFPLAGTRRQPVSALLPAGEEEDPDRGSQHRAHGRLTTRSALRGWSPVPTPRASRR